MTLVLGAVADDYTGASDLANTLTRAGLATVQTIGVLAAPLPADVDAVVVALKTRSCPAEEAVARSLEAARWLRGQGAGHILFKICSTFDSTDAGNIGPVMDALREDARADTVIVTPAFPETGRTVYLGHLFVNGVPLHESPLKNHPLNPMHDSNLMRVLRRQSRADVGLVSLAAVADGAPAIGRALAALATEGKAAAICDAVFDSHLDALGTVAVTHALSVGASGLGRGLARALVAGRAGDVRTPSLGAGVGGLAAGLAGSCSAATLEQIHIASAHMPVHRLDSAALLESDAEVVRALAFASRHLADGPVLIASSETPQAVGTLQAKYGAASVGHAIESAHATLAEGLLTMGVRQLVVAGGETSGAVVDRLALRAFRIGPEIASGVPALQTLGREPALRLALKSGNFGKPSFFADAFAALAD